MCKLMIHNNKLFIFFQLWSVGYRFREAKTSSGNWQKLPDQDLTVYNIYGLVPNTTYELRVLAKNKLGDGGRSEMVSGKTSGNCLLYAVHNVLTTANLGDVQIVFFFCKTPLAIFYYQLLYSGLKHALLPLVCWLAITLETLTLLQ